MVHIAASHRRISVSGFITGFSVAVALGSLAIWAGVMTPQGPGVDPGAEMHAASAMLGGGLDPWSAIGSSGMLDERSTDKYNAAGGALTIHRNAPDAASVIARYPVPPVDGIVNTQGCHGLLMRFKDNGSDARVLVKLKQYNATTGNTTTIMTVDSNDFSASTDYQLGSKVRCGFVFDFVNNTYYVEAILRRNSTGGKPQLGLVRISTFSP